MKLKGDNGVYKDYYAHVLVAITYLQYIPSTNKIVINHIDGIKGNNQLNNLEIITHKENMKHSAILNHATIFRKAVYYLDENGQQINFKSAKDACIATGIDNSSILKSCKNTHCIAGKRKWYFII